MAQLMISQAQLLGNIALLGFEPQTLESLVVTKSSIDHIGLRQQMHFGFPTQI